MRGTAAAVMLGWVLGGMAITTGARGQTAEKAAVLPKPDDRYKADVLLVVAHPDDDTGVLNYITRASLDEGKRVAVIFSTRGNSGGNAVGMEQGKAMSDEREMEARRSLELSGIRNVWFLHGSDTATQDVLHSLETLGHGEALEEVVRLIRLTRPEVVLTWAPAYVAGENHGDHQASGVVATEAFDLAGDPTVFAEQINAPRSYQGINNYGEGLHPWQAKKLYFVSDASHQAFLAHHGPTYLASDLSKSKGVPYATLNKKAWDAYATQTDPQLDYYVHMPDYFLLAKTYVPVTNPEADIWDGVTTAPIAYVPAPGYRPESRAGVTLELGGPWAFYRRFAIAHGLTSALSFIEPQTAMSAGNSLWVPLLLENHTDAARDVLLHADLPAGWEPAGKDTTYHLEAHSTYPAQLFLTGPSAPVKPEAPPVALEWLLSDGTQKVGAVRLKVYGEYNGVPQ